MVLLRKRFCYLESIPGVLLPHPSSSPYAYKIDGAPPDSWHLQAETLPPVTADHHPFYVDPAAFGTHQTPPMRITPSMSSLEALLSKLPSVVPPPGYISDQQQQFVAPPRPFEFIGMAEKVGVSANTKEVVEDDYGQGSIGRESSGSAYPHLHHHHHHHHHHRHHYQDQNASSSTTSNGF